jgi:hypothetical protein
MTLPEAHAHPLTRLSADDQNMVASFVLVSGSIKELAREYGVSYPTMRNRLDALIERLREHVEGQESDPMNDHLAELIARGQIHPAAAKSIRDLHRRTVDAAAAHGKPGDSTDA